MRLREPVNGLTHAAGGLLAFVGLIVLVATATGRAFLIGRLSPA